MLLRELGFQKLLTDHLKVRVTAIVLHVVKEGRLWCEIVMVMVFESNGYGVKK
jgi:hypothetical protein